MPTPNPVALHTPCMNYEETDLRTRRVDLDTYTYITGGREGG